MPWLDYEEEAVSSHGLDYEEEAVSSHGRVEALRLGRKPAGNPLIYFSIYVPLLYGWTDFQNILCLNGLEYLMIAYVRKCHVWTRSNAEYGQEAMLSIDYWIAPRPLLSIYFL